MPKWQFYLGLISVFVEHAHHIITVWQTSGVLGNLNECVRSCINIKNNFYRYNQKLQAAQLKRGLADRTAKTAVLAGI